VALLLVGCANGTAVGAPTTAGKAQATTGAGYGSATQATPSAQATAGVTASATSAPQGTATAQGVATTTAIPGPISTPPPQPTASATPSASPARQASGSATAAASAVDLAGWPVTTPGGPDPARVAYDATTGRYTIALTAADHAYVHWQYSPQGRAYGDFALDIDGQALAGPAGGSWGILFRAQPQQPGDNTNSRYDLIITPSKQEISVNWTSADGHGKVLALATIPALHTGEAVNHVQLTARGDRITVAINGQTIGSATGPSTTPGAIGLIVLQPTPQAGAAMAVAFSHLVVAALPTT